MSLICEYNKAPYVIICGDLVTDFNCISLKLMNLNNFVQLKVSIPLFNVIVIKLNMHLSAWCHIDHMLISDNLNDIVEVYETADGIDNESDHIPVICSFNFECVYLNGMETQHYPRVAWYKPTLVDIGQCKLCLDKELDQMYIFSDAHECRDIGYTVNCNILNFCHCLLNVCIAVDKKVLLPSTGKPLESKTQGAPPNM